MPALPKDPTTRARRNKTSTSATLTADPTLEAPALPERGWHSATVAWWRDVWASPMAPEFDDSDLHGLFMLAAIVDDFWCAETARERAAAAAEIRLQSQRFGLSPMDRRRLQWEIARGDEASERSAKRARAATEQRNVDRGSADPRSVLRALA